MNDEAQGVYNNDDNDDDDDNNNNNNNCKLLNLKRQW